MGTPCNCCGESTTPREACDTSGETIPPHPSAPSARVLTAGNTLTTETQAVGAAVVATFGGSTVGRYDVEIEVTSQQANWHAFAIIWLSHADLPLDPHVIGSLNELRSSSAIKISDISGWDASERNLPVSDRSGPWLIPTLVIEQGGKLYYAYRRRLIDLTIARPCCWVSLSAGGVDGSEIDRMTRGVFAADRSSASESVVSGNGILCSDAFGRLRPDGTLDPDDRPNLDLGTAPHPITRVGFALGLSSCPRDVVHADWGGEGTFRIAGQLGPVCGSIGSWGSYYTSGPSTAPEPPGTLLIDEPLDALPAGWATGDLLINDGLQAPIRAEGSHAGAVFTARDGATFAENVGLSEYPSGTLSTTLPIARADWVEGSQFVIEFTSHRARDEDRRYALPGAPAPHEYRNQTHGVFIGGLLRFMYRHQNAQRYDEVQAGVGLTAAYGWRIDAPIHRAGGIIAGNSDYTEWPTEWTYDPQPNGGEPPLPYGPPWQVAGEPAFDGSARTITHAPVAVNDGDRVGLVLTLSRPIIANPYDDPEQNYADPTIVDWLWQVDVWCRGRKITGRVIDSSGNVQGKSSFRAPPPLNELRIGLLAMYGGGWSNLKVWRA